MVVHKLVKSERDGKTLFLRSQLKNTGKPSRQHLAFNQWRLPFLLFLIFSFLFRFHSKSPAIASFKSYALVQATCFTDEESREQRNQVICPKPRAPLSLEPRSPFITNNKLINLSILLNINRNNSDLRPHPFLVMVTQFTCVCVCVCVWACSLSCVQHFCDPMDDSSPVSSVHGISQAKILEWVAISYSRESSQPRNQTHISCLAGRFYYHWATKNGDTLYSQFKKNQ